MDCEQQCLLADVHCRRSWCGRGTVSYRVARNLETADRTAAITVADQTFTVSQTGDTGGCRYSVAPVDVNLCMAGGTVTTTVTTQPNCTWTASVMCRGSM